jgi:hypothetical protein
MAGLQDAGAVIVLYGSAAGLTASGSQQFSQATPGVPDAAAAGEGFGLALAAANFGNGAQDDLAIGVPGVTQEDQSTIVGAGAVTVLYGSTAGLTASGSQLFSQASPGVAGAAEYADSFGFALAAANLGNSGQADLAVGVPGEDLGGLQDAGAVNVVYGSTGGLTATGNQLLTQDSSGIANLAEAGDGFGTALAAANFGRSGQADLAIGVPVDARHYGCSAAVLAALGVRSVRLLTNNPAKYGGLEGFGLKIVERVPLPPRPTAQNLRYLKTKAERMGHLIELPGDDAGTGD